MERTKLLEAIPGNNFCEVIAWINTKHEPPPTAFPYYWNLCSQDTKVHWDLKNDTPEAQSTECLEFIYRALNP